MGAQFGQKLMKAWSILKRYVQLIVRVLIWEFFILGLKWCFDQLKNVLRMIRTDCMVQFGKKTQENREF